MEENNHELIDSPRCRAGIDISMFARIERKTKRRVLISFDDFHRQNIYSWLKHFGFRYTRIGAYGLFFVHHQVYRRVSFEFVVQTFKDFIRKNQLLNLPEGVSHNDFVNVFCTKRPVNKMGIIMALATARVTEHDLYCLKLLTNPSFRAEEAHRLLRQKLQDFNFILKTDMISSYGPKVSPLYYRSVGSGRYIVFNEPFANIKGHDCLDAWLANYDDVKDIGHVRPTTIYSIRTCFDLATDWVLLEKYF